LTRQQSLEDCFETTLEEAHVITLGDTKQLVFDARNVQSSMRVDDPNALAFGYTRAMMGVLLFNPEPRDILIVGLGGGSLSKYCYYELPECTVTTVELSKAVIELRDEFVIPADDERFRVVHADASLYMRHQNATAGIILLDGYAPDGLPPELISQVFYDDCFRALRPGGVLSANLWGADIQLRACFSRISHSFEQRLLRAKSDTSGNDIAFGLKQVELPKWLNLQLRARHLQRETGMNFTDLLDQLCRSARDRNGDCWLVNE
jgi:spermidine synthase